MSAITVAAPSAASRTAMALPAPALAPVTSATFPSISMQKIVSISRGWFLIGPAGRACSSLDHPYEFRPRSGSLISSANKPTAQRRQGDGDQRSGQVHLGRTRHLEGPHRTWQGNVDRPLV